MESSSSAKNKKINSNNKSNLSNEYFANNSMIVSDDSINHTGSNLSDLSDISTANMSEWNEKSKIAIRNIKNISSNKNSIISDDDQKSLSALSDTSSVFLDNPNEIINKKANQNFKTREIKKNSSKRETSTSEEGNGTIQSDANFNDWNEKNIETIAHTPIFNKKRIYDDGATSEEFNETSIIEEEEEMESNNYSSSKNKSRGIEIDPPILDAGNLSSASSIDTGDAKLFDDINIENSDQSKKRKKKKVKKITKDKSANSSANHANESASETLSNYSDSKRKNSQKATPRNCTISEFGEESNGSKIYFNSETSDAPAVKRVKKKIDNLLSPRIIDTPNSSRGVRVQYTDEEIISPRRKQKYAQIFIDGDSEVIDYSAESDMTVYGRLPNEKYPQNVTDSELSDISLVDFDTPKVKYLKSPVRDILYNDSDYQFNEDQMKIEKGSFSSNSGSLPYQTRDIDLGIREGSEDDITNDVYEEAQRKIQKFAIEENEVQENGALFDIKIPDSDEEGKLLLDLKKNAIMLSSSSSHESEVEDEDKLEMLGEMVVNRGLPFLKLSDSESEGDPLNAAEEEIESNLLNQYPNEESSEPPIQYDVLLAPKSLTTPRSPKTPRTPNEPVYTGNLILTITVIEAINLPRTMPKIRLEPYVFFKLKGSKEFKRTKTCRYTRTKSGSSLSSSYKSYSKSDDYSFDHEKIVFVFDPNKQNILTIKVRDEDKFGGDIDISGYDFVLSSLKIGESDGWFRLDAVKNAKKGGKLHVQLNLEREEKPEPPHTPRSPKTPKSNSSQNSEHSRKSQNSEHSRKSQNSEHSRKSHNSEHSRKSQNSELSQISQDSQASLGSIDDTENESNNDDIVDIDDNLSSISEGNRKREYEDDIQKESNFDTFSDHLNSPSGSEFNSNA